MTVSSTTNRASFSGNGVTTTFSFPYFFINKSDLYVALFDPATGTITAQVLNSDFTVTATADASGVYSSGGSVVMSVAPASGLKLVITRIPVQTQATHWVDNDPDPAAVKELAFDKLTLEVQRLQDLVSRCFILPDGFGAALSTTLPSLIPANSFFAVNNAGTAIVAVPTASPISVTGTRPSPNGVVGASGITPVALVIYQTWFIQGSGGPVDITANPQIAAGDTVGQQLLLVGRSDTNTVLLENGNGLSMNGDMMLGEDSTIQFSWDGTNWREDFRKL